jgi:hypothetical protein
VTGRETRAATTPESDLEALPGDWWAVSDEEAAALELELAREVPVGHVLRDATAHAVAVRRHMKDVVYWLPGSKKWALVHLTHRAEADPTWPATSLATDWDGVVAELVE